MKCKYKGCDKGHFCYGYSPEEWIPSDDVDGGGYYIGEDYDWGACPCCDGVNYEDCPNCSKEIDHEE